MDAQAAALLNTLKRPAASSDAKLAALNALKSDIKHHSVPENAQAAIFECLKLAITQQASSTLASSAFSALSHLIKRLNIQDASGNSIVQLAPRLFPALEERLGDLREPVRTAASQALTDLYPFCTAEVEEIIRDNAIGGTNPRAKQSGMQWVLRMHEEESMPFKSYVQAIVARLEDSDGTVRESAKSVVIDLFRNAPDRAQIDLKRQLKAFSVRTSIETQILSQLGSHAPPQAARSQASHHEPEPELTASVRSQLALDHSMQFAESTSSEMAAHAAERAQIEPLYVHSRSELEDIFRTMLPFFEGKETEHNWTPRDKSILKVRRMTIGNAPSEYHAVFMGGIKSLVEGILKVANSLRTTMSTNGCHLVQDLARTLGPALDPQVEMFLQAFIKMSAATKHIAAENGRQTAEAIFQNCSYNSRMMQHIWSAAQEKNAQVRQSTPEWLKTILKRQANYKSHFESSGGLELAEKCIAKGLDDANPKVKESMRGTYWIFAKTWPDKAHIIMSKLDPKTKVALEKDPNNPNAALLRTNPAASVGPARGTGAASRNTLREMMAEKRKAREAGKLPDRPNSAMAQLSPVKARPTTTAGKGASHLSHSAAADSRGTPSSAAHDAAVSAKKGSSLMSGPVRRPRRPEVPRPQTADPYASKRLLRPETPAEATPSNSPPRAIGASATSNQTSSTIRSRVKGPAHTPASPRGGPANSTRHVHAHPIRLQGQDSRPTSKGSDADLSSMRDEDFTMVMPGDSNNNNTTSSKRMPFAPGHKRTGLGHSSSVDSAVPGDEDNFTMVLPGGVQQGFQHRAGSPLAYRSPLKAMFEEARERMEAMSPKLDAVMKSAELQEIITTPRSGSPSKSNAAHEEVQIYEDPIIVNLDGASTGPERKVLAELPVNENVPMLSPAQSNGSAGSSLESPRRGVEPRSPTRASPEDRAEMLKNRRLLASGIERIRKKTLDAHGFRRVQELAKSPLDIWDEGRSYDELMAVLLQYLQSFDQERRPPTATPHRTAGLKAQALGLARALLTIPLHAKAAAPWHSKALVTVLACSGTVDGVSLVAADLERAADEIIKQASPETCIDAILEALPAFGAEASRSTAMGLMTLRRLLETAQRKRIDLGATRKVHLVRTTAAFLDDRDAEVRKTDVELASELFELFGSSKAEFWNEFRGTDEGRLGLLTYYIARRGKALAGASTAGATATAAAQ